MEATQNTSPRMFLIVAIIVASFLSFIPQTATAEPITFVRTAELHQVALPSSKTTSLKKVRLALDDEGNVMVRYGSVSVTFIYEAGSTPQESRIQQGTSTSRQEVACLGGLSVKFGVTF